MSKLLSLATKQNDIKNDTVKNIQIKNCCDNKHKHCYEIVSTPTNQCITQDYFNCFMDLVIGDVRYNNSNNCLSYNNYRRNEIIAYIILN